MAGKTVINTVVTGQQSVPNRTHATRSFLTCITQHRTHNISRARGWVLCCVVQVQKLQVAFPFLKQDQEPGRLELIVSRHFAVRKMVECTPCDVATCKSMVAVLSVTVCL